MLKERPRASRAASGRGGIAPHPSIRFVHRDAGNCSLVVSSLEIFCYVTTIVMNLPERLDAAPLYRLALEKGSAGARYQGVADEGVPFRHIAGVIGRRLNVPVVAKSAEEVANHFGWLAHFVAIDCPASGALTQKWLGWRPSQPWVIADLDSAHYFEPAPV